MVHRQLECFNPERASQAIPTDAVSMSRKPVAEVSIPNGLPRLFRLCNNS